MSDIRILFFLMFITTLLFYSCDSTNPSDNETIVRIKAIEPSGRLKIGQNIKVIFEIENLSDARLSPRQFIDGLFYGTPRMFQWGDTLSTYVPYIPTDDSIWIYTTEIESNNLGRFEVTDTLVVEPENCNTGVYTKFSDIERFIDENYTEFESYGASAWSTEIKSDTVIFSRSSPGHDESHYVTTIKLLDQGVNELPIFLEATKIEYGQWVSVNDTLKQGLVKIQDWNINGIVSGFLLVAIRPIEESTMFPERIVFWADLSE